MLLIETLIAAVQEKSWGTSRNRVEALEVMFDKTRVFQEVHIMPAAMGGEHFI